MDQINGNTPSKKLGLGLGYFSLALGAIELAAPKRIARALGLDENGPAPTTIRTFGLREIAAGIMLLRGPAVSTNVWNRVLGDGIDIGALLLALGSSTKPRAVAGALAFVGGATALDVYTARALDRDTGRTFTPSHGQSDLSAQ
jgi:hypothetical protein